MRRKGWTRDKALHSAAGRKVYLPHHPHPGPEPADPENVPACGCRVRTLKRVRIMNIVLGDLKPGEYRKVEGEELEMLRSLAGETRKKQTGEAKYERDRK